jgi:hypothetical protein
MMDHGWELGKPGAGSWQRLPQAKGWETWVVGEMLMRTGDNGQNRKTGDFGGGNFRGMTFSFPKFSFLGLRIVGFG